MTHPIAYETIQRHRATELQATAAAYRRAKTARRQPTTRRRRRLQVALRLPKYVGAGASR